MKDTTYVYNIPQSTLYIPLSNLDTTKYQNLFISSTSSLSELPYLLDDGGENKQPISTVEAKLSPVRYQTNSILLLFKRMVSLIMKITLIQILLVQSFPKLLLEHLHLLYNYHLLQDVYPGI